MSRPSQDALAEYIETHHKTHLIFDFDATLILTHTDWDKWAEILRGNVRALGSELWDDFTLRGAAYQNQLVQRHGKVMLDLIMRDMPAFELQYRDKFTRNEPLLKQVEAFKDLYHMYMWSSNTRQLIEYVLEQTGMSDWFEKIVTRNDVRYLKPNPEGFLHIYDPEVPEDRYLLIGDSSHDHGAAEKAGIDFFCTDFFKLGR